MLWRSEKQLVLSGLWRGGCALVASAVSLTVAGAAVHRVPEDFPVIRSALDACADGDTVLIGPGVYQGPGNRDLVIQGNDIVVTSVGGAAATIIDCEGAGRGFEVLVWPLADNIRIEGLTITHGYTTLAGAAIDCGTSTQIVGCRLVENSSSQDGGALDLCGVHVLVEDCEITHNDSTHGGGVYTSCGNVELVNCVITNNWAAEGGAVAFGCTGPLCPTLFRGCTITSNTGFDGSGGLEGGHPVVMENCILWGNSSWLAPDDWQYCSAEFRGCVVNPEEISGTDYTFDDCCVFTDPLFCDPETDWTLHADSPCLPENSPCGQLIGARGLGCGTPTPTGACCLPDQTCAVLTEESCQEAQGMFMGQGVPCDPDPCDATSIESVTWGRNKQTFHSSR